MAFAINKLPALFWLQILAQSSIIASLFLLTWNQFLIAFVIYFFSGCVGMSMIYHRYLSHRSWNAPRWIEAFGCFAAVLGLTGSPLAWVANHRQHHMYTDQKEDPHSPNVDGFFRVQFLSMLKSPNLFHAKDLAKDPMHRFFHRHYLAINAVVVAVIVLLDPMALLYAYLLPAGILWNMGSAINSINHLWGYTNFNLKNSSKNNLLTGLFVWGEGWHNNHHKYPTRFNFGINWWEFDLSAAIIKLLDGSKRKSTQRELNEA